MKKYLKKRKNISLVTILVYLIFFSFVGAFAFLYSFNKRLGPGLIQCAVDEVEKLTVLVLNRGVKEYLTDHDRGDLLDIVRDNQGEIELVRYDTRKLNEVTMDLTSIITDDMKELVAGHFEKLGLNQNSLLLMDDGALRDTGGIIFYISMGSVTGNNLLANLGPKIPLNLSVVENVESDVHTKVTNYGVNSAMIEVFVDVRVYFVIQMPFMSKKIQVKHSIPLTMEIIQGGIPNYYFGSLKEAKVENNIQ